MKLKNILRQERFNGLNKILMLGVGVLFVIAAIYNKSWVLAFVAACFIIVGFTNNPSAKSGKEAVRENMEKMAEDLESGKYDEIDEIDEDEIDEDDEDEIDEIDEDAEGEEEQE